MSEIGKLTIEVSATVRNFGRSARALANSMRRIFSPTLADKGYIIINRRGRNKLVDTRRMK